jgi:hypothetical protein
MKKKKPMSDSAKAIVERCKKGERLCKSYCKESGRADVAFILEPSGRRVNRQTATAVIESGLLAPQGDGLFGTADSQSWGVA